MKNARKHFFASCSFAQKVNGFAGRSVDGGEVLIDFDIYAQAKYYIVIFMYLLTEQGYSNYLTDNSTEKHSSCYKNKSIIMLINNQKMLQYKQQGACLFKIYENSRADDTLVDDAKTNFLFKKNISIATGKISTAAA